MEISEDDFKKHLEPPRFFARLSDILEEDNSFWDVDKKYPTPQPDWIIAHYLIMPQAISPETGSVCAKIVAIGKNVNGTYKYTYNKDGTIELLKVKPSKFDWIKRKLFEYVDIEFEVGQLIICERHGWFPVNYRGENILLINPKYISAIITALLKSLIEVLNQQ